MDFTQEITTKLRADFTTIRQACPKGTSMFFIKPYASSSIINIGEELSSKYGKPYEYFFRLIEPIANNLMKEYFG